jgi:hypothetical protein
LSINAAKAYPSAAQSGRIVASGGRIIDHDEGRLPHGLTAQSPPARQEIHHCVLV